MDGLSSCWTARHITTLFVLAIICVYVSVLFFTSDICLTLPHSYNNGWHVYRIKIYCLLCLSLNFACKPLAGTKVTQKNLTRYLSIQSRQCKLYQIALNISLWRVKNKIDTIWFYFITILSLHLNAHKPNSLFFSVIESVWLKSYRCAVSTQYSDNNSIIYYINLCIIYAVEILYSTLCRHNNFQ